MEYKTFIGSVERNDDTPSWHGKITNITDLVNYEGVDLKDLENCFKEAVDDYLETCQHLGKLPQYRTKTSDPLTNILSVYTPAEPLTKENFFNHLQSKYPKGMKVFCDWIDSYKKAVGWIALFNAMGDMEGNAPKYHDLPFAMQIGIWIAFIHWCLVVEKYKIEIDIVPIVIPTESWKYSIENFIAELQCIKDRDL